MMICLLVLLTASTSLMDAQSLEEAGPELDLEYYSNLKIDENEMNTDSVDHTLDANLFEGDIDGVIIDESNQITAPTKNRNAIVSEFKKWPGGVIPYLYYNGYSEEQKAVIAKAIKRLQEVTCLRMVPRTTESNYIYMYPQAGCTSHVGHMGIGKQVVSLTKECFYNVGTILHEFMHAVGFQHEHSRIDRDEYVKINWQNIKSGKEFAFQKYTLNEITHLGAPYDTCSIMHYRPLAFSINKQPTIEKIKPGGCELGEKKDFSDMDIRKLNTLYQCDGYPQVGCTDQHSSCQAWATTYNYCSVNYVEFMMKNCCESCKLAKCKDDNSSCDYWASSGFCKGTYEVYMVQNCKKSCRTC